MGVEYDEEATFDSLDKQLNSIETPLAQRFRALFTLKGLKGRRAIDIIAKGFDGESALLGHELAYVLGQIKDPYAIPTLMKVLEDPHEHVMVRHEAAEALGAIGDLESLPVLKKYLDHDEPALRETAEIAVAKIEWDNSEEGKKAAPNAFATIDPAPAASGSSLTTPSAPPTISVPDLQRQLLNTSLSLFIRYRAMFALRDLNNRESVLALATGFSDTSALFRHEIAYVFGQLSSPHSVPALIEVLKKEEEEEMVRHEAAEALGGIATDDCLPVLREYATKEGTPRVVRESCEVALDMYEHERSEEFSYGAPVAPVAVAA